MTCSVLKDFFNFSNFPVMFLNVNQELLLSGSIFVLLLSFFLVFHFLFVEALAALAAFFAAFSASIAANFACSFSSATFWR